MAIRTPDDEVDRPGYFYPPFKEGWHYQGATYPGHSDFSVDFNRRTSAGGWLDDAGDPVLAAADGTVAEVAPADGTVLLNHHGALYRTEYRHMRDILVKQGDKVQRGDRIGSIGDAGNAPNGAHLHHVHWRRDTTAEPFRRAKMRFYDKNVAQSVGDSDLRGPDWEPPAPELYVGPPPKATWETAYRQAEQFIERQKATIDGLETAKATLETTVSDLRIDNANLVTANAALVDRAAVLKAKVSDQKQTIAELRAGIAAANARIAELEAASPIDCAVIEAERDAYKAQAEQLERDLAEFQVIAEPVYVRHPA